MDRVVMVLDLTHVYNFHCWIGENFAILVWMVTGSRHTDNIKIDVLVLGKELTDYVIRWYHNNGRG